MYNSIDKNITYAAFFLAFMTNIPSVVRWTLPMDRWEAVIHAAYADLQQERK